LAVETELAAAAEAMFLPLKLPRKLVSAEEKVPELPNALFWQLRPMKELQTLPLLGTVKYLPVVPLSSGIATFWNLFLHQRVSIGLREG
jgi:hypothetical protein